ncbi:MAG: 3-hydroxyacyl-CoA dehydrogenase [Sulfobacillus benefaciens]|uniref:3-hydroxyacyl-CoA dehydrogenase n=1 Tax=Sulfobacillus benefaciens TaxID=453960 RepID=A0A2T2XH90_9FIRM|nr:MAG: 3-hydroxyacyl-CoA dehydrogenase [Sulfobacillus benefaciens]
MEIRGKTFLITGGASGLGAATARILSQAGGHAVIADVDAEHGQAVAKELDGQFVKVDVTKSDDVKAALTVAQDTFGGLHGVVNCAGIGVASRVLGKSGPHPLDLFERVIDVNLIGTFNVIRLSAEMMAAQPAWEDGERGAIVMSASVAAFEGQIGQAAYSASKGGIVGLVLPLAREFARFGIRVMAIAPGIFDTPMLGLLPEEARASLGAQMPFPSRLGKPSEFGQLVRHIMENTMLNGEVIRIDGAIRMQPH